MKFALAFAAVCAAVCAAITAAIIIGCRLAGHASCNTFERETGRTTKWVVYHPLDTGGCLTPARDGKWIPTSQLRDVE